MSGHWENVYEFSLDALIWACCAGGKEGMRMEDIVNRQGLLRTYGLCDTHPWLVQVFNEALALGEIPPRGG